MKTIIHNGKVICPDSIIQNGYIEVENGAITGIKSGIAAKKAQGKSQGPATHWIDAEGNYISPGFIDLHVHGVGICDFYKDPVKGLKNMAKILASQGVTSFLPTFITAPINKIIDSLSVLRWHTDIVGANVLGVNLEGPFINPKKCGAHPVTDIRKADKKDLKDLIDAAGGNLRIITLAPEIPGVLDFIDLLKENAVIPAIGHTMASFEETMTAIDRGFNYISHTFNAMTPFHHRAPGAIGAILIRKEVTTEIIADGTHVHPAVVKFLCQIKEKSKIILVTDVLSGIMRKGDKTEFADKEITCTGPGAYDSSGTLMGGVTPMNKALQNIAKFADLNLIEAVKLATINPANVLGIANRKGSIEIGKDADIVIFGEDFKVKTTIIKGKVI